MQTELGVQTHAQSWAQADTHTQSVFSVIWEAEILLCCDVSGKKKDAL